VSEPCETNIARGRCRLANDVLYQTDKQTPVSILAIVCSFDEMAWLMSTLGFFVDSSIRLVTRRN
jgi:hypothetical protein